MKTILLKLALLSLFFAQTVSAEEMDKEVERPDGIRPFVSLGITAGGDKLGTVVMVDGETDSIYAGGEIFFSGGLIIPSLSDDGTSGDDIEGQFAIGYHEDSVTAENGDFYFRRYLVEGLQFILPHERVRFGIGLAYHFGVELNCDAPGICTDNIKFDNALGYIAQIDYVINRGNPIRVMAGLRYTHIEYDMISLNGIPVSGSVDGSNVGLHVGFSF